MSSLPVYSLQEEPPPAPTCHLSLPYPQWPRAPPPAWGLCFFLFFNVFLQKYIFDISLLFHSLFTILKCVCVCFQYLREIGTCSGEGSSVTQRDFCGFRTIPLSHTAGQSRTGATHRGHQWATLLLLLLTFAEYFTQMHLINTLLWFEVRFTSPHTNTGRSHHSLYVTKAPTPPSHF